MQLYSAPFEYDLRPREAVQTPAAMHDVTAARRLCLAGHSVSIAADIDHFLHHSTWATPTPAAAAADIDDVPVSESAHVHCL